MRNSIQRNLVYDIIQVSCDHPTADMVYLRAKQTMPKISLGTVYRNLNELVELGKILRINFLLFIFLFFFLAFGTYAI